MAASRLYGGRLAAQIRLAHRHGGRNASWLPGKTRNARLVRVSNFGGNYSPSEAHNPSFLWREGDPHRGDCRLNP
jgi:hypothetical protein